MLKLPLLLALFSSSVADRVPQAVELDVMTVAQAWALNGKWVVTSFTISCPPDTYCETTVIGAGTDEVERSAYVPKDLLLDKGQDVTVVGVLRVKINPPAWVNGQRVPVWTEIWAEGIAMPEVGHQLRI
jgi:hypothetical protein